VRIVVRYFAAAREAAGLEQEEFQVPDEWTVGKLITRVVRRHPPLREVARSCRFALDERLVPPGTPLREGSTVAFIPPVSGG